MQAISTNGNGLAHKACWLAKRLTSCVVRNSMVLIKELVNGLKMNYKKSTNYHRIFKPCELICD